MFPKFAVLLVVVLGTMGCVSIIPLDPNRPFPKQPAVSSEIKAALVGKKMSEFVIHVDTDVNYYNISMETLEIIRDKNKILHLREDFPRYENPTEDVAANGKKLRDFLEKRFAEKGFRVEGKPCKACLTVKLEFAEYRRGMLIHWLPGSRIYYLEQEVAVSRDDKGWIWRQGLITLKGRSIDDSLATIADNMAEETIKAWEIITTVPPERVSAIQ